MAKKFRDLVAKFSPKRRQANAEAAARMKEELLLAHPSLAEEPKIVSLQYPTPDGSFVMGIQHAGAGVLAASLAESLKDAENFLTLEFHHETVGKIMVTIRKGTGKTVEERYMEVSKEARELREQVKNLNNQVLDLLAQTTSSTASYTAGYASCEADAAQLADSRSARYNDGGAAHTALKTLAEDLRSGEQRKFKVFWEKI